MIIMYLKEYQKIQYIVMNFYPLNHTKENSIFFYIYFFTMDLNIFKAKGLQI